MTSTIDPSTRADPVTGFVPEERPEAGPETGPVGASGRASTGWVQRIDWGAETLDGLIRRQVGLVPGRPAVLDDSVELSYAQLDARCDEVAATLQDAGVARGDLVAVCLGRTVDLVAALLAVHRVGAAYVPLDPHYPVDRLSFMVTDSAAAVVLADGRTADLAATLVAGTTATVIDVDADTAPGRRPGQVSAPRPTDVAYVIYTSGSTGRPKGVMLEHRNTLGMLEWIHTEFSADDLAGVLLSTSVCFDLSVFEIFGTLTGGGTVIVAENGLALPTLRHRDRVTLLNTVPGVTAALLRTDDLPAGVRVVIHSGDTTSRALADAVYAVPTVERLYNLYGPTEVVTWQIGSLLQRHTTLEPPIGTPFPGVGVHVLDPAGHPVPEGVVGELHLSGRQVSRGYLGRPELTAERFVERPELAAGRCYATGDLVARSQDGQLHYRGRSDFQIKIRGFRVELGEIEAVLERHPAVEGCVVVVQTDGAADDLVGRRRIVAHVQVAGLLAELDDVRRDENGLWSGPSLQTCAAELTALVGGALPEYMVPNGFGFLKEIPTTPNGKPDRARLPRLAVEVTGRPAATDTERRLVELWRAVLGSAGGAPLPVDVPFTDLGGDSLLAATLVSRIRRTWCPAVSLAAFSTAPTIAATARLIDAAAADGQPAAPSTALPVEHLADPGPVTQTMLEGWLGDRMAGPSSALWVVPVVIDLVPAPGSAIDPAALQHALDELVRRHSALSTAVIDEHTARTLPAAGVELRVVPLPSTAGTGGATPIEPVLAEAARTPLDITAGVDVRAVLGMRPDGSARLLLQIHHCVYDGLSYRPLIRDLAALYAARQGLGVAPPAPLVTFDDARRFVRAQHQERSAARSAHWHQRLASGGAVPATPLGSATAPAGTWEGGRVDLELDPLTTAALRTLGAAAAPGRSPFVLALAACAVRAHREAGTDDLLVSAPVSSRDHEDLEDVVGLLHDVIPIRCDLSGAPSAAALLDRIAATVAADIDAGAPDHAQWQALRGRSRQIRPDGLVLALQRGEPDIAAAGGPTWQYRAELDNGGAKSDLTLFWEVDMPVPRVCLEFARQRYTDQDALRYLQQVITLALAITTDPSVAIADLPLLTPTGRAALESTSGAADVSADRCDVLASIIATARSTPDRIAIHCPTTGSVSYRRLLDGARAVAEKILALDAATPDPTVPVAVGVPRSARAVAALLGVWLSHRSYLPVDVTHPAARITTVLADSEVRLLVAGAGCPPVPGIDRIELQSLLPDDVADWPTPTVPDREPVEGIQVEGTQIDAPAYRLYTSGSTGTPKGVTVPHGALGSFLHAIVEVTRLREDDVVAFLTTCSFDISGLEMWLPLVAGAQLRVIDEATVRDGQQLARALQGCTVVQMTPTGWQILLSGGWAGDPGIRALVGGEGLSAVLAEQLLPLVGELHNVYGPTETTIWSAAHRITAADLTGGLTGGRPPIGRPLSNTVVHLIDRDGRPVADGMVGEICIGGHAVADGYHRRPDLTAAAFVALPWLPHGSAPARFYRTGDRGRRRPDGLLECLGRTDGQVKVRGVRMEIGEIEAAARRVPGIADIAVAVHDAGEPQARLIAYFVAEHATSSADVEERLRLALPASHVPEVWVPLPSLPTTANGKLDRTALPDPSGLLTGAPTYEPPATDVEQLLADIIAEVLGIERVGRLDSFLDLGGHSLSATRVTALVRSDLELVLPVRLLFESPRLCDLAAEVDELLSVEVTS